MSLVTRLSLFFLVALAVVLAGFSVSLYLLAKTYLYRQVDERLETALHTLVAIAEIKPDGVEWEPQDRLLSVGQDSSADQVRWMVQDGEGRFVKRSPNLGEENLLPDTVAFSTASESVVYQTDRGNQPWRFKLQRLQADDPQTPPRANAQGHRFPVLILATGASLQPLQAALRNLALALTGLSLGLWLLAALVGRWLCRRALRPMTQMAAAARTMKPPDLGQCLPSPGTADELEDLGQAFNDLLSRLHEAFQRQRRFTGDASHQLRTPLTAVLGQIEIALHKDRPVEEYRQSLQRIHGQAIHLHRIVEALLFLARADAEANLPDLEIVDLAAWLNIYLKGWSNHPRHVDLCVERFCDGPLLARVHLPLLDQLLGNLVDNACKYSAAGTPIVLRLNHEAGQVTLMVEDAGCGIAADDLPHIFEPFYRSAQARRAGYGGTGLGLAVAQRIAQAFHGTLSAESEPGHGTRFLLRLPEIDSSELPTYGAPARELALSRLRLSR